MHLQAGTGEQPQEEDLVHLQAGAVERPQQEDVVQLEAGTVDPLVSVLLGANYQQCWYSHNGQHLSDGNCRSRTDCVSE